MNDLLSSNDSLDKVIFSCLNYEGDKRLSLDQLIKRLHDIQDLSDEIIGYEGIGAGILQSLTRGVDDTLVIPHNSPEEVQKYDPNIALTDNSDGLSFYRRFAELGPSILNENGFMLLEIGVNNKLRELYNIFCDYNLEVFKDLNQIDRVIKVF